MVVAPAPIIASVHWRATDTTEFRANWLGHLVLWVQEERLVYRPVYDGIALANWQKVTRWRRARLGENAQ